MFKSYLLLALLIPALALADAAEELKTRLDKMQDLSGRFAQILKDKSGATLQATQGDFSLKRPGYFLWQSAAPYAQTVVGTPEKVWVYDPDLEQVTVRKVENQPINNPARLLSGDLQDIKATYQVDVHSRADELEYRLVPRAKDSSYRYVELVFVKEQLVGLNFQDKLDQQTHIEFTQIHQNTHIPVNIFEFIPPEGTDVITDD
jgi:outer membrane lipoprotein carrier protein